MKKSYQVFETQLIDIVVDFEDLKKRISSELKNIDNKSIVDYFEENLHDFIEIDESLFENELIIEKIIKDFSKYLNESH